MQPFIKPKESKLRPASYELIDRDDRHVIAEWHNTFDLSVIAGVYEIKLGRLTDIRQKENNDTIL